MNFHSVIYLGVLTGLFLGVGYLLGGESGVRTAFIFAVVMNIVSYWFSDKIVLMMYRAKRIEEKDEPEIHATLSEIAKKMGLPTPPLYLIDMPVPNAFATGRNPQHSAVAVTHSITQLLTHDELAGVLAHELSHIKNRDVLISTIAATIAGALSIVVLMEYWTGFGNDRERQGNVVSLLLLVILTPLIAMLLQFAISRSREFLADETGAKTISSGLALASALEKLHTASHHRPLIGTPTQNATAHLFIVNPFSGSFLMKLFSTHPPLEERVHRLRTLIL